MNANQTRTTKRSLSQPKRPVEPYWRTKPLLHDPTPHPTLGVSAGHLIQMHDGVMASMNNLNPNGKAAKQIKTHIDKEILKDLTFHTRQQLDCWIQLTVKSGHNPTDVTCDVPRPHLDNSKGLQNTPYPNGVLNLGKPRITLTIKPDMSKPNLNHQLTFGDEWRDGIKCRSRHVPLYTGSGVSVLGRLPGGCGVVRRTSAGPLRVTEGRLPRRRSGLLRR